MELINLALRGLNMKLSTNIETSRSKLMQMRKCRMFVVTVDSCSLF